MSEITSQQLIFLLAKKFWSNWETTGKLETSIDEYQSYVIESIAQDTESTTFTQVSLKQTISTVLAQLGHIKLIEIVDSHIQSKIPFSQIAEHILPEFENLSSASTAAQVLDIIKTHTGDATPVIYQLLESAGIINITNSIFSSICTQLERDQLRDKVLTKIEENDSQQIEFGIYETEQTGKDLLLNPPVPNDPLRIQTDYAIRSLLKNGYLLPFEVSGDVSNWKFRSRIGETVRLLEQLKQRFPKTSFPDAAPLVKSIKFEVHDRKYPKLECPITTVLSELAEIAISSKQFDKADVEYSVRKLSDALKYKGYKAVSEYQRRSFKTIFLNLLNKTDLQSSGFVLTAGTGMGKTLSYLVPLLFYCILDRRTQGVKSINIYPRIKLAENQFASFSALLYHINADLPADQQISIGIDYTGTPYKQADFSEPTDLSKTTLVSKNIDRLWIHRYEKGFVCPYLKCPKCGEKKLLVPYNPAIDTPLKCENCNEEINWIKYSKEAQAARPPNILILTTEMLNKHLHDQSSQALFGDREYVSPKLIMIDEIHLHTSLKGSHTSLLLKRLLQRIKLGQMTGVKNNGSPYVIGLSATIGEPKVFFSELTGISEANIVHEEPKQSELEKNGAEYYIFIKPDKTQDKAVISTLLQTCMCVIHTIPKKTGTENENYKTIGFVDSLDTLKRWSNDFDNAESNGLFRLRNPAVIKKDKRLQSFIETKQPHSYTCDACKFGIDRACPLYKAGECWWFMHYGNPSITEEKRLKVKFNTAAENVDLDKPYDLLVTTSAMEVGYDDPDIRCVIQYQVPENIASFSQRKGRAGRSMHNRPLTVIVINPYNTRDSYYYQNHHYLTNPAFSKPPLNTENESIKEIHGFYAILDRIAFYAHVYPTSTGNAFPSSFTLKPSILEKEILFLRNYWVDNAYIQAIVGRYTHKLKELLEGQLQKTIDDLDNKWSHVSQKYISIEDMFPNNLPKNLFTTLNLPSVTVCNYYPHNQLCSSDDKWVGYKHQHHCPLDADDPDKILLLHENGRCSRSVVPTSFVNCNDFPCTLNYLEEEVDINLGLTNNYVGKATLRYKGGAYWIPPTFDETSDFPQYNINLHYLQRECNQSSSIYNSHINITKIPATIRPYVPHISEDNPLLVYRPDLIRLRLFQNLTDNTSKWVFSDIDESIRCLRSYDETHDKKTDSFIDNKSKTYPISFYTTAIERIEGNYEQIANHVPSPEDDSFTQGKKYGPFGSLLTNVEFATSETGEYINAKRALIGGSGSLLFWRGKHEQVPLKFGFNLETKKEFQLTEKQDVALGYELHTEGLRLDFNAQFLEEKVPRIARENSILYQDLLSNFFKAKVFLENRGPTGFNSFTLTSFLDNYLHICYQNGYSAESLRAAIGNLNARLELLAQLSKVNEDLGISNSFPIKNLEKIFREPNASKRFLNIVADAQEQILEEKNSELINKFIIDTFIHSFKHTLKSVCINLGGFERERDINGWCEMSYDFDDRNYSLTVFEQGMYGNGGFRTIYQKYLKSPLNLWNNLLIALESCPTSHDEYLLRSLLSKSETQCEEIEQKVNDILTSTGAQEKNSKIQELGIYIRDTCNVPLTHNDYKQVLHVFSPPTDLGEIVVSNWRLYKEINVTAWSKLYADYHRTPSTLELLEYCIKTIDSTNLMPEWKHLMDLISKSGTDEMTSKRIKSELEKRLLNTCVDGCPSCLQTACDLDSDPSSRHLLLSRRLLQGVIASIKEDIEVSEYSQEMLVDMIKEKLHSDSMVYLKYTDAESDRISKLLVSMLNWIFTISETLYRCFIYSDRATPEASESGQPKYELCLSVRSVML